MEPDQGPLELSVVGAASLTPPRGPVSLEIVVDPLASPSRLPKVPAHAWAWLQRSRPVLDEVARQLTGQAPTAAFLERLRAQLATDPFVADVVVGVVADVAFRGRLPTRRPAGTTWDRGLTWWAATIAGTTPQEFEARSRSSLGSQRPLFDAPPGGDAPELPPTPAVAAVPRRPPAPGRAAVAAVLRDLLGAAEGGQIPVAAVRQLLVEVEGAPESPST